MVGAIATARCCSTCLPRRGWKCARNRDSRASIVGDQPTRSGWKRGLPRRESGFCPSALASMTSKYVRELAMQAFNEFWVSRVPGLQPTAGYPADAKRFHAQIRHVQQQLGIPDDAALADALSAAPRGAGCRPAAATRTLTASYHAGAATHCDARPCHSTTNKKCTRIISSTITRIRIIGDTANRPRTPTKMTIRCAGT